MATATTGEHQLRHRARRLGLTLSKARGRSYDGRCWYLLAGEQLVAGGLTLDELEAKLREAEGEEA